MATARARNPKAAELSSQEKRDEDRLAGIVTRFRSLVLTSPLWLAAIMIALNYVGGPQIQNTIQFLTASPLR